MKSKITLEQIKLAADYVLNSHKEVKGSRTVLMGYCEGDKSLKVYNMSTKFCKDLNCTHCRRWDVKISD